MPITTAAFAAVHGPDANVFTVVAIDALIIDDGTDANVGVVLDLVHRDTGQRFRQLYECSATISSSISDQLGVLAAVIRSGQYRDDQPLDPDLEN